MNRDRIASDWKQSKGNAKEQRGKLADDQFDVIARKRDNLVGGIQKAYGITKDEIITKDEAEKQLTDWQRRMEALAIVHGK